MAHPNEDLIRQGYAAFAAGDIPAVLGIFSPDIVWSVPGRSPIAGTYKGHDEVVGFFGKLLEATGGDFSLDIVDVVANEEHVAVILREVAKGTPIANVHVWTIADGKATEFRAYSADQYGEDAIYTS